MTLFLSLPRRLLRVFGLALLCASPLAYSLSANAAELEGTVVPIDAPHSVPVPIDAPKPVHLQDGVASPDAPDAPAPEIAPTPPDLADQERWEHDTEAQLRETERQARANERQMREHHGWERELEKNLSQAFGGEHRDGDEDDGPNGMEALIVLFSVMALILILCSPLILVGVYLTLRYKAKARHRQALNSNIDKLLAAGRDIPVELLRGDEPRSADDTGNLPKGIRNLCLGAGWLVFLTIALGIKIGAIGFVWIGMGLSQVLIWYLNKPAGIEQAEQQD